jgi:hypothetical protein
MAVDYFILITWGFFGVLQIVASYSGLHGLRLFPSRRIGYLAGIIIAASAFAWFFETGNRTMEGHLTGIQGAQQFGLILAGVVVSFSVTVLAVSILHIRSKSRLLQLGDGLEQIRDITYLQMLIRYLRRRG